MTLLAQFEAMHEQAAKTTGLADFGPDDYVVPLKLLLSSYDKADRLSDLGKQITIGATTGILVARLLAQQGFKAHPKFANAAIEKPIIIIGMPRTGSTALHRLLAKDPGCQWLPPWLGSAPMPRPARETWAANPWFQMTEQGLALFYQLFPRVLSMHPIHAAEPDECHCIINHTFWAPQQLALGARGEYLEWFAAHDAHDVYAYYRKVLGLIAGGDKRHWVLKDPNTHLFASWSLLDTFPDARIVYTHREPVSAMSSVSSLVYAIRESRERALTTEQNSREQLQVWGTAAAKMEPILDTLPADRVFDLHISELGADPVGSAERIYRHFNQPVTEATRAAWTQHAATDARSGHGAHDHRLEHCGFSASDVYDCVGSYGERYKRQYGHLA